MALEIVWRNPRLQVHDEVERDIEQVYCGMSLCILRTAAGEVIFQIDEGRSPRRIMEVKRAGGV
jgi:hypothetical protein